MLPSIIVDPSTLWIVSSVDSVQEAETAIANCLSWMKPNASGPLQMHVCARSVEALAQADAFPAEPRLAQILRSIGLEGVINPKMLATSVSRFLANSKLVEDGIGPRDFLLGMTNISPDVTKFIAEEGLRSLSVNCFGLAAICDNEEGGSIVYAYPRQTNAHSLVRVNSVAEIVEFCGEDIRCDLVVDRSIVVLAHPSSWAEGLSADELWRSAESPEEIEIAISLASIALNANSGCGIKEFRVGSDFFDCIIRCGAIGDGNFSSAVLQKCAQALLKESNLQPKPFYVSADANASVRLRKRDGAKAWRLHVTKSHEALRLMYWELPCGGIEFATLEEKGNETIHEGQELLPRRW